MEHSMDGSTRFKSGECIYKIMFTTPRTKYTYKEYVATSYFISNIIEHVSVLTEPSPKRLQFQGKWPSKNCFCTCNHQCCVYHTSYEM